MQVIQKPRGGGKTRELIELAHKYGYTIVCFNQTTKRNTKDLAKKLGLEIPEPVTVWEIKQQEILHEKRDAKIVVDDADVILQRYLETEIHVMTVSE